MAINIKDKVNCTGCEACANICPYKCIRMQCDNSGFLYPTVDPVKCIECKLCIKVCPILNANDVQPNNIFNIKAFAGWSKNEEIRYCSTSGGIFSELAYVIIENHGYVSGAAYGEKCAVFHDIVNDIPGIHRIRQSKYTQSQIGDVFVRIEQLLKKEKKVLFSGTPCQVAALKNYLGYEYENLYTADFICRGVNSPKAYQHWLAELEDKYRSKVTKVWFKYKKNGWKRSPQCTRIDFADGSSRVQNSYNNTYMRGYLGPNLYIRPSCGDCKFKGTRRNSDITLADFWGISKEFDDDRGTSLIMVNSAKGQILFDKIKGRIFAQERNIEEIYEGNVCFTSSVAINSKSEEFLKQLDHSSFSELIQKYAPVSKKKRIAGTIKRPIKYILTLFQ